MGSLSPTCPKSVVSVISEILAGRRTFNTRQIAALVQRFHVAADAFIEHDAAR